MDQLQLPVDVVGQLLLLLQPEHIQRMRLVCQSWQQAVDHQLRVLRPLYLPPATSAVFSNCEAADVSRLRSSGCASAASAAHTATSSRETAFVSQAPIRNFSTVCSTMQHAASLDLTAQQLPPDGISQLVQHMPRLQALNLCACDLVLSDARRLAAFAASAPAAGAEARGLSRLCLPGVKLFTPEDTRPGRGSAAGTAARGKPAEPIQVVLDAVTANALTHLDISTTPEGVLEFGKEIGQTCGFQLLHSMSPGLRILGNCSRLEVLSSSLASLKLVGNPFDAADWQHMCNTLTLLTELHISWDSEAAELSLNAASFEQMSKLQRLQSVAVHFKDPRGLVYEPYSLAPLADTLTALQVSGSNSLSLMLSLTECSSLQRLQLCDISGAAATPELLVQLVRSMPVLRELHLERIWARQLVGVGMCHLGDYLLSQLDCCAPQLTQLVMPNIQVNGTGIRLAATTLLPLPATPACRRSSDQRGTSTPAAAVGSAAAAGGSSSGRQDAAGGELLEVGMPGSGALRRLQHLELNAEGLMSSALPHLSCLTALESLTLRHMAPKQFSHACRFDCFRFVSALTRLTQLRLSIPNDSPAGGSTTLGGAGAQAQGAINGVVGGPIVDIDLLQLPDEEDDSDSGSDSGSDSDSDELSEDDGSSDGSAFDSEDDASGSSGGGSGSSGEEDWQEADEGGAYMAAGAGAPGHHQQQPEAAAAAAAAGGQPGAPLAEHGQGNAGQAAGPQQGQGAGGQQQVVHPVVQGQAAGGQQQAAAAAVQQQQQQVPAQPQQPAAGVAGAQAANQLVVQFQQQQQAGAAARPVVRVMEPHLHFLARLTSLVSLNLGCLNTQGPCLMHLSSLTGLQTLLVSGQILLSPASLALLAKLRLPSVRQLSMTGCRVQLDASTQQRAQPSAAAGGAAAGGTSSCATAGGPSGASTSAAASSSGGSSAAGVSDQQDGPSSAFGMDLLVPVLCAAFPGCQDLRVGSCASLSIVGLAGLLQGLSRLQRLWLEGVGSHTHPGSPVPSNFVPAPTAGRQRRSSSRRHAAQQQSMELVAGHVLPYIPHTHSKHDGVLEQSAEEMGWFLAHGVVVEPERYAACSSPETASAAAAAAGVQTAPPARTSSPAAAAAGGEAAVLEGAVVLPCVHSHLKYVFVARGHQFVRYMGRMVPV